MSNFNLQMPGSDSHESDLPRASEMTLSSIDPAALMLCQAQSMERFADAMEEVAFCLCKAGISKGHFTEDEFDEEFGYDDDEAAV